MTTLATVKSVPIVGTFVSRIFKKSTYKEGFGRFREVYCTPGHPCYLEYLPSRPALIKFINRQPMTAKEKSYCTKKVLYLCRNWQKRQKKDLQNALNQIKVIPDPPKPKPPEVHKVSASALRLGQTAAAKKSGEIIEAGISKTPIYVLVGIGVLFILPQLLKTKGGKE